LLAIAPLASGDPPWETQDLIEYLRAGDDRLLRPEARTPTLRRRAEASVHSHVPVAVRELCGVPPGLLARNASLLFATRTRAAQLMSLLVLESPPNRQRLGAEPCVIPALISLVDTGWRAAAAADPHVVFATTQNSLLAAEAAAEAIWLLAFNHAANHRALVEKGALAALGGMLTAKFVKAPARSTMWAAAALQNLAASYCDGPDGRCGWRREEGGALRAEHEVTVDAAFVRLRIARLGSRPDSGGGAAARSTSACSSPGTAAMRRRAASASMVSRSRTSRACAPGSPAHSQLHRPSAVAQ